MIKTKEATAKHAEILKKKLYEHHVDYHRAIDRLTKHMQAQEHIRKK